MIAAALVKYNATLVAVDGGNVLINNNTATLVAMRVNIKEKKLPNVLRLWSQLIATALVKYNATLVAVDGGNVLINNNTATLVAMSVNIKEKPT